MPIKSQATIEDLYHVPDNGKAEIVNGELRLMSPTGHLPGRAALRVAISLDAHAQRTGTGRAYGDNGRLCGELTESEILQSRCRLLCRSGYRR